MTRWLEPGFRHCYAMTNEMNHFWIVVDPASSFTNVYPVMYELYPTPQHFDPEATEFVRYRGTIKKRMRAPVGVYSCVEIVKSLIGVSHPWIITPHQLYRWLNGTV